MNPVEIVPEIETHNKADDFFITRAAARFWNTLADPLVEHFYGPVAERNHLLGIVVANATLTLPRLPAERALGNLYEYALDDNKPGVARAAAFGKFVVKGTDGLDGPVVRAIDGATKAGAAFDGWVDMQGIRHDAELIINQARKQGDWLTIGLMRSRIWIDDAVMAVGGVANTVAAFVATRKGIELDDNEKPGANPMAKIKYTISAVADASLMQSYTQDGEAAKKTKRFGQAATAVSIGAGLVSLVQYGKATASIVRKIRKHSKETA